MSPFAIQQDLKKHKIRKANAQTFYLVPTGPSIGLTSVSLGLLRAMDRRGIRVGFWKPIAQPSDHHKKHHKSSHNRLQTDQRTGEDRHKQHYEYGENGPEPSAHFCRAIAKLSTPSPSSIPFDEAEERWWNAHRRDELLQDLVETYQGVQQECDMVIVEGLQSTAHHPELDEWNHVIVRALGAEVVIVSTMDATSSSSRTSSSSSLSEVENVAEDAATAKNIMAWKACADRLEQVSQTYGGIEDSHVIGCIFNGLKDAKEVASPADLVPLGSSSFQPSLACPIIRDKGIDGKKEVVSAGQWTRERIKECCPVFSSNFRLLGAIPFQQNLMSPRTLDMQQHLGAEILNEGDLKHRRISQICVVAMTLTNMAHRLSQPNTLILTPGDRDDIFVAACMAALNGTPLAGIVLTGGIRPSPDVWKLCEAAFKTGIPILSTKQDSFTVAARASTIDTSVPADDVERMQTVMDVIAGHLEGPFDSLLQSRSYRDLVVRQPRMSPPAFLYNLVTQARSDPQRIVLPEGNEPRVIQAACLCHARRIAKCVLIGDPDEIARVARVQGIALPDDLQILAPTLELRQKYAEPMVELRKHKGVTMPIALQHLEDVTVLSTMMLAEGHVDGLVSGAIHSTANTVRPALQLIKTTPSASIVSSIFFMCLPEQVLIYGDCAINPDPTAEQLADIALQSADSAEAFGIDPRVALISYSTGTSGQGDDVDKVRKATIQAKERRPDLVIDGPLQYDAASSMDVARSKAPDSQVAGRATVLIFPDLNTGNTTYKAVQRTAHVVAIGPMLQGLRRPVNDLSRGARVEDILYTIALTAIQAQQIKSSEKE